MSETMTNVVRIRGVVLLPSNTGETPREWFDRMVRENGIGDQGVLDASTRMGGSEGVGNPAAPQDHSAGTPAARRAE